MPNRGFLSTFAYMNILATLKNVNTFIFDMDGVLTDGKVTIVPYGAEPDYVMARSMHTKDGYAIQLAVKKGYTVAVISGGIYPGANKRFSQLGIKHIFMGITDKQSCLKALAEKENINLQQALFMGDDIPDHQSMLLCGVKACPADAVTEIKNISDYISPVKGGEGCVRDVIEKVLKLRSDWNFETKIPSK